MKIKEFGWGKASLAAPSDLPMYITNTLTKYIILGEKNSMMNMVIYFVVICLQHISSVTVEWSQ